MSGLSQIQTHCGGPITGDCLLRPHGPKDRHFSFTITELCRRRNHHADALARKAFIKKNYTPRHADIYTLTEEHLDARFRELTKVCVEALQMQRETTTTKTPMDNT